MYNDFVNVKDHISYDQLMLEEQQLKNELLKLEVLRMKQTISRERNIWGEIGVLNNSHLDTYPKVMFNGPSDYPLGNQVTALI